MKKQLIIILFFLLTSLLLSYNFFNFSPKGNIIYSVFSASLPTSHNPQEEKENTYPPLTSIIFEQTLASVTYNNEEKIQSRENDIKISSSEKAEEPIPENITETEILKGGTNLFDVEINNETDYDLKDSLNDVTFPENPTVLIVHTHTSESYRPSLLYPYTPRDNSRTEDINFNVARVGKELATTLSSYGINVIHDSSINDYPSYNGSYKKTLELIENHLERNPSIDIIIDLHRDAMERSDGTKLSTVCSVNGEKAAQVMLVVGTDRGGLNHPYWRDNFSFAVKLQTIINKNYPHLARPINVRRERFNGHVSKKELIIEVGTTGNTMEEALVSARAIASAINEFYVG